MLRLSALSYHLVDEGDNLLVNCVSLVDGIDHGRLRNLIGTCFNHDYLF